MDRFDCRCFLLFVAAISFMATGCGTPDPAVSGSDAAMIDDLLMSSADDSRPLADPADPVDSARVAPADSQMSVRTVSRLNAESRPKSAALGDRLELRLREGDRFPLVKSIEQTLQQRSDGAPAFARTRLELTLAITVEQVAADAVLLGVRYSRVVYEHDVGGQRLLFDSSSHEGEVPWDAIPYSGMVGNGFSFWLGRDNAIRELVGYKEFLERCVAQVPLERRETLLSEISNRFGDDGVANFVDDSIGLLPYDSSVDRDSATRVLPGDVWTRERRLMQPVPVHLISTYRLTAIDDHTAEIDITGRIAAGDAAATNTSGRLRITGGHSIGRCIVDRVTGLPLDMHLTRRMTMKVTTSDHQEVVQDKTIVTTIRAFPERRGPVAAFEQPREFPRQSGIQQVSGVQQTTPNNAFVPQSDGASRAVRAVYPD